MIISYTRVTIGHRHSDNGRLTVATSDNKKDNIYSRTMLNTRGVPHTEKFSCRSINTDVVAPNVRSMQAQRLKGENMRQNSFERVPTV
jgi:hypothetical protein